MYVDIRGVSLLEGTPVWMVNWIISLTIRPILLLPQARLACSQSVVTLLSTWEVGSVYHSLEVAGLWVTTGLLRKATLSHLVSVGVR